MNPGLTPQPSRRAVLLLIMLLLLLQAGCASLQREGRGFDLVREPSAHNGRLNLFLTLEDRLGPATRLEISRLEILAKDLWLPLTDTPILLDSKEIGSNQYFLGGMEVPPGLYDRLRMTVAKVSVRQSENQTVDLLTAAQTVELPLGRSIELEKGDSRTLLFTWDVAGGRAPDRYLSSAFFIRPALRQLSANILFVSCPEINTIFVVRTDKNWVVDSLGVRGAPTYLAIDPNSAGQRLYVLTPKENKIKIIDVSSQRVINFYPTLTDEATYMTVTPDGTKAYLLHEKSGYVSRMDLRTGQIESRVLLGSRPIYAAYLEEQRLLAVSLNFADSVVLLDPDSLKIVKTITTGSRPEGISVSDNILYVAESGEASVTSIDLTNISNKTKLMVGFGPRRILDTDDQIIVANYDNASLSILFPGQLGSLQEIYGFGNPLEMTFDPLYRRLYVADEGKGGLAIVDTNANQLVGHLLFGARPLGLAGVQ